MKTHQLGLFGETLVRSELLKAGFRVAVPDYDSGMDLIAYRENYSGGLYPVQVKTVRDEVFFTDQRLLEIPSLRIVYCWHALNDKERCFYCLPYEEAERIVDQFNFSRKSGKYFRSRVTGKLLDALEPYRATDWNLYFPSL